MNKRQIGAAGESAALNIYLKHGYCLVTKNWHFKRFGEIDLILSRSDEKCPQNAGFIVFCEVKLREINCLQTPAEAVGILKQNRIRKLAEIFIQENAQYENYTVRFDIAEIYIVDSNFKVRILTDAF